ncbi:hypothetical protein Tco_0956162 [Tanacetum coccineum]|uniref:Uncharacterized protein n=1 Tax=Tanacetum coccineum TaxID=301880 RepID=A0ABQ5E9A0_9ASTR
MRGIGGGVAGGDVQYKGRKLCIIVDTLTQWEPHSMLAAMFSGHYTYSQVVFLIEVEMTNAASHMPSSFKRCFSRPIPSLDDVLRESRAFAACDETHGRWAKQFGVRSLFQLFQLFHSMLRLLQFLRICNTSQEFTTAMEKNCIRILLKSRSFEREIPSDVFKVPREQQKFLYVSFNNKSPTICVLQQQKFGVVNCVGYKQVVRTSHADEPIRVSNGFEVVAKSEQGVVTLYHISVARFWYREPKFLIKMPPRKNRTLNKIHKQELEDHVMARMEERFDQFVDQLSERMDQLMNRHGNRNSRGTNGEQSDNPFGEDDDSSSDE